MMVVCPPSNVEGGLAAGGLTGGGGLPDSVSFLVKLLTMLFSILGLVLLFEVALPEGLINLGMQGLTLAFGLLLVWFSALDCSLTTLLLDLTTDSLATFSRFFFRSGILIGSIFLSFFTSGFRSIFNFFSLGGLSSSSSSLVSTFISASLSNAGFKVGGPFMGGLDSFETLSETLGLTLGVSFLV